MSALHIACISDLHLDHAENKTVVAAMAQELIQWGPDVLIIAGDLASTPKRVAKALELFQNMAETVVFVPGNHDLWYPFKDPKKLETFNTWQVYRGVLPAVCEHLNIHYLPSAPLLLPQLTLVGTMGWYDYSFASPLARLRFKPKNFIEKQAGGMAWTDGQWVRFRDESGHLMSDAQVAKALQQDLQEQLDNLPSEHGPIMAVTHTLPFTQAFAGHRGFASDFFTAYMGHRALGETLLADNRVRWAVHGHSHTVKRTKLDHIEVFASPLGTPKERRGLSVKHCVQKHLLKLGLDDGKMRVLN